MMMMMMMKWSHRNSKKKKDLKNNLKGIPEKHSIDSLQRQLYLQHHTQYRKYCSLKLEE
jgi:hypothetical protein